MKRNTSRHSHSDEKLTSSRNEEYDAALRSRTGETSQLRRNWIIQQEREREHKKLKEKKILEFEIQRAHKLGLPLPKKVFSYHSRSKSRSESPHCQHRSFTSSTSKLSVLSEKLQSSEETTPLFKGLKGTKISTTELRKIKVDIHRNIPGKSTPSELQRDIVDPEDVVLKRRAGEGSKPIFEREEIKRTPITEEIEEHRTVVTVNNETLENKSETFKKHAVSLNPARTRSHSPQRTLSHSRHESSRHDDRGNYRSDREKDRSRGKSREYKGKDRRHTQSHNVEENRSRERSRRHDHSREREQRKWDRDPYHRDERSYRESRERSRGRSRERRDRDRSRERRVPSQHYIEQIPVPIYYGNFPPRPIMVGPLVPIRGQGPLGSNRHPMIGPLRPFAPRFIPADMYRLRPPLNPRFGSMF